jgi:hypothetical protein
VGRGPDWYDEEEEYEGPFELIEEEGGGCLRASVECKGVGLLV